MYDSQKKYEPRRIAGGEAGRVATWLVIIVLVVAVGAWLLATSGPKQQLVVDTDSAADEEVEQIIPEPVYAYVGSVVSLGESSFELLATADQNNLSENRQLTVVVDEQTSFIRLTIPNFLPTDPAEKGVLFKREEITFAELEAGAQVTVVSVSDIRESTSFTARRVEVQLVK